MPKNRSDNLPLDSLLIRALQKDDINRILEIESECNLARSNYTDYARALNDSQICISVASIEQKLVGFVDVRLITPVLEIVNIAVSPEFKRLKIGRRLLQSVFEIAARQQSEEIWLEVRESNVGATAFYLKHDFKITGRRRNYYSNPVEDALLMSLKFSDLSK